MSAEVNEAGYETIRDFIASPGGWNWVELRDDTGAPITRVDIANDPRASWVHGDGDQVVRAEIEVRGSDGDIPLDTTFTSSASYDTDTSGGGNELATDSFPPALIASDDDELIVTHQIEVPEVV